MIPLRFTPPQPIEVWCAQHRDLPRRLRWRGRIAWIATIEASWSWGEGWWRADSEAASRAYHRVATRDGLRCRVYRDLASGRWYLEAIRD